MSTKGIKLVKEVKFIEFCRKEHTCTFCTAVIPKNSTYFTFSKYIWNPNNIRTYIENTPYKCCFKCYPEFHESFRAADKPIVQLTLGVVGGQ